ncbi:MAG TPA: hypothetical protein PLB01_02245 [Thermoanaerobaculia bacterium]|nr:hypothetical protein [Thermoanaerobaculia bacterium]
MGTPLRIFVLDESRITALMVERVAPHGTVVAAFTSLAEAACAFSAAPPDAAVVSLTGPHAPWREFRDLCASRRPLVPILYESCLYASAEEAGLEPTSRPVLFLHTPAPFAEFQRAVAELLAAAIRVKSSPNLLASA